MSGYKLLPTTLREFNDHSDISITSSDEDSADEWERNDSSNEWMIRKSKSERGSRISFTETRLLDHDKSPSISSQGSSPENEDLKFPTKVYFIIGNEFCERFCYYGLRTILVLYFSNELLMSERSATSLFHAWGFLSYFTTIFGAIIADSFLGRYRTIIYLSILYLAGNFVLSAASVKPWVPDIRNEKVFAILGLVMIAFGTGGIKPCVSSFGGDQFKLPEQEKMITNFFAIFYFSINAGSFLSTIVSPILREDVSCFGGNCFPLAFGLPGFLMFIALVLFISGTSQYNIVQSQGNIVGDVIKCISWAGYRKITLWVRSKMGFLRPQESGDEAQTRDRDWLDLSSDRFSWSLISDVRSLLQVLLLFLPLPIFWTLYNQQASRWTFQATRMSGSFGTWTIKPDQMQVMNPIFLLLLIPAFDSVVYPFLEGFGLLKNPLKRMFVGGILASLAFVTSGIVQLAIENSPVDHGVIEGSVKLAVINTLPCPVQLVLEPFNSSKSVPAHDSIMTTYKVDEYPWPVDKTSEIPHSIELRVTPESQLSLECDFLSSRTIAKDIRLRSEQKEIFVAVTYYLGKLEIVYLPDPKGSRSELEDKKEVATMRIIDSTDILRLSPLHFRGKDQSAVVSSGYFSKGISYAVVPLTPELTRFQVYTPSLTSEKDVDSTLLGKVSVPVSSSSVLMMFNSSNRSKTSRSIRVVTFTKPSIHMFWLIPQYLLMSAGEVMFSITGLEFSFTHAPTSMKSVVQASWLLTTGVGDLFVILVAENIRLQKQSMEFFLFAGLLFLDMLIFHYLASRFKSPQERGELEVLPFISSEDEKE